MKKIVISLAAALATTGSALAGGLNTNTNANAAYLRFFAQDANITLTSLYANPAGSAFLSKGWHFGIHDQIATQHRNITTQFPLFAYNQSQGWVDANGAHTYEGKAFAPLIPSIDFSYNSGKKWSINAHLGVVGGGGACEYLDGIGSFETMYASQFYQNSAAVAGKLNSAVQSVAGVNPDYQYNGYSVNSYMRGSNFAFGLQVGATYKITDNLAVFGGVRAIYATATYNGYVQDATLHYTTKYANDQTPMGQAVYAGLKAAGVDTYAQNAGADLSMNCDQTGYGVTPLLGIHWTINKHWNLAAKYEFKTKIRMKNTTRMNNYTKQLAATNPVLGQFADGASVADDMPGYLAVGTQYSPIENVRIGLGYHWIQETKATKYNNKQNLIDNDTHEVLASVEWRCHKYITVSGGWQKTMYGVSDAGMNDVSFNCSNNSMGLGVRIHPSKLFNIDLGYMHTFYQDRTVATQTGTLVKTDTYSRKNDVVGIGLNFAW